MTKLPKTILTLVLFLFVSSPNVGQAVEFGLTPSTVYGMWKNINDAVLVYANERSTNDTWLRNLENMPQDKFSGKAPANVLEQVTQFNTKLNEILQNKEAHLEELLLEGDLSNLLASSDDNLVTPSLVYMHSGQVLINIVEEIVHNSPTGINISPFFDVDAFPDKTPSDVFSLVDLGLRYLDEILIRQEAGDLTTGKEPR
ncbi:MAG: hypothetical protein V7740_16525 [Pseudomonas marincola]